MRHLERALLAAVLAACASPHERPRDSLAAARAPVTLARRALDTGDAPGDAGPARDLSPSDPWLASADSAIRRRVDGVLFSARRTDEFSDCSEDEGSENPTIGAVAVRARPIRRTSARYEPSVDGYPVRTATYDVEVQSVAVLVPQWISDFPVDTTIHDAEQYEGRLGTRTDTVALTVVQRADSAAHGRWEACEPEARALSETDGPGYGFFVPAAMQGDRMMRVVRWVPADGSWERVVALADSARKAEQR